MADIKDVKTEPALTNKPDPVSVRDRPSAGTQHYGEYDALLDSIPDINNGERVFILLSPEGTPISVQRETPAYGVSAIVGHVGDLYDNTKPHLTTESGAELTDCMNPHPEVRFEGAPPEVIEASGNKFRESRENGPKRTVGSTGEKGADFGESPQLAGAYEDRATHPQSSRPVGGTQGKVEGHKIGPETDLDAKAKAEAGKAAAKK